MQIKKTQMKGNERTLFSPLSLYAFSRCFKSTSREKPWWNVKGVNDLIRASTQPDTPFELFRNSCWSSWDWIRIRSFYAECLRFEDWDLMIRAVQFFFVIFGVMSRHLKEWISGGGSSKKNKIVASATVHFKWPYQNSPFSSLVLTFPRLNSMFIKQKKISDCSNSDRSPDQRRS